MCTTKGLTSTVHKNNFNFFQKKREAEEDFFLGGGFKTFFGNRKPCWQKEKPNRKKPC
jgi:hypothetical protein